MPCDCLCNAPLGSAAPRSRTARQTTRPRALRTLGSGAGRSCAACLETARHALRRNNATSARGKRMRPHAASAHRQALRHRVARPVLVVDDAARGAAAAAPAAGASAAAAAPAAGRPPPARAAAGRARGAGASGRARRPSRGSGRRRLLRHGAWRGARKLTPLNGTTAPARYAQCTAPDRARSCSEKWWPSDSGAFGACDDTPREQERGFSPASAGARVALLQQLERGVAQQRRLARHVSSKGLSVRGC
jgi:hypothetical protein